MFPVTQRAKFLLSVLLNVSAWSAEVRFSKRATLVRGRLKRMNQNVKPTLTTYAEWQTAYDFFNKELFDGRLPECIITLDNKSKRNGGYFAPSRYKNSEGEIKDGLAMNPWHFHRRSFVDTLSTLVHEMCHVWQQHYGQRKRQAFKRSCRHGLPPALPLRGQAAAASL